MKQAMLEMRSITKEFPGVKALADVTLTVHRADIHAICGENGAGKSTLMKVLSGVYPHGSYEGQIIFEGQEVQFRDIRQSEAAGIVIIHQELALIPELSIAENIFLGNETATKGIISWDKANHRAIELLARVGLAENPLTPVKHLGIGKQQLVEIAKALSKDVKLLILDEPTAALNDDDSQHLLDLLKGLQGKGVTSIMISHKLNEIEQIADEITIIRDGRSIETLDISQGAVDEDRMIRGMVGRDLENRFPHHTPSIGEVMFEVRDWTVMHPQDHGRTVIDSANVSVRKGEIVGIAGLMGAGRTELARSIFGRSYGSRIEGTLTLNGKETHLKSVSAAIEAGIAYLTEDRKSLGLNLIDDIKTSISSAGLHKLVKGVIVDDRREVTVAQGFGKDMNIKAPSVEVGVAKLSGGNQQKVVLSKWMFTDPQLLILDEPTRGIDVGAKFEIYGIIQRLADQGRGVIIISSELPELLGLCDRIYTLAEGRVTHEFSREEADQESLMRYMTKDTR
ncbi:MAG: multiple monosaccharide ABC transporter ATP-binding protein [Nocardioides sp.]